MFQEIWNSIFEPGPNKTVVRVMNGSFICLFILLIALGYVTRSFHVFGLLAVAVALFASIQWYSFVYHNTINLTSCRFLIELQAAKSHDAVTETKKST
jgi:hypothetical protein